MFIAPISTFISALLLLVISNTCHCDENAEDRSEPSGQAKGLRLLVLALVENPNSESFIRFNQSAEAYKLDLVVVNLGGQREDVKDSDSRRNFKIIHRALASYRNEQDLLIMVAFDSSNLIINGEREEILARFSEKFQPKTRILFAADSTCWPDTRLESRYPSELLTNLADQNETKASPTGGVEPSPRGLRFLDSRTLIGYASSLWEFFEDEDDKLSVAMQTYKDSSTSTSTSRATDGQRKFHHIQLFATHRYLDERKRRHFGLALDHRAELFENLHSTKRDAELELGLDGAVVKNAEFSTRPLVIHGSGSSQVVLNSLGNYLGRAWTRRAGCRKCNSTMISLATTKDDDLPLVLIGVFIVEPTPFLEYFFDHLLALNYPKQRIHLLLYNTVEYHAKQVDEFWELDSSKQYAGKQRLIEDLNGGQPISEPLARDLALSRCRRLNCDYYLALDSVAHLQLPDTLRLLIETNRTIVAPLLNRPRKLWSNFWGSITTEGYYSRSHDYVELVGRDRIGIWNVPLVMNAYLVEGKFLRSHLESSLGSGAPEAPVSNQVDEDPPMGPSDGKQMKLSYFDKRYPSIKPVLIFSRNLRAANVFQFVTNMHEFGHLVDPTSFNASSVHPDFYQLENNMIDWERKYLHENYAALLADEMADKHLESPCQDVYWFPLVNGLFCRQLIEIMESFGRWSSGTNHDPRIEGGYESVPTRDIHFKQVGLHEMWLTFLREYIMPVQLKEYIGYEHDPPRTDLAFVVRYHPAEQPSLRPHHDSSTYTLNIALNEPGVDYQGGGCRFVRYNCSVTDSRTGWALIHPGRLTHYHEGLPVTNGTRYILVTFVDP